MDRPRSILRADARIQADFSWHASCLTALVRFICVAGLLALTSLACSAAPEVDGETTEDSSGDALIAGIAASDATALGRMQSVTFVPSSDTNVTTWATYLLQPQTTGATPSELLFVNHANPAPIVVYVDTQSGKTSVLAAPPDGAGVEAFDALVADLAGYADVDSTATSSPSSSNSDPSATQSLTPLGLVDGVEVAVVKEMLSVASKALGLTSDTLRESVYNYTKNFYAKLNPFLRDGVVPHRWTDDQLLKQSKTLTQALETIPPMEANVHRWSDIGLKPNGLDAVGLSNFLNSVRPGTVFEDAAFLSTTANDTPPELFGYATVRFDIHGFTGRDVSAISEYQDEREVLFLPHTKFLVKSVTGEFVPRSSFAPRKPVPRSDSMWMQFYDIVGPIFGISSSDARQQLYAGRIPNLVITLEEVQ